MEWLRTIGRRIKTTGSEQIEKLPTKIVEKLSLGGFVDLNTPDLSSVKVNASRLLDANKEWVYRNNDVIAKQVSMLEPLLYKVRLVANGDAELIEVKSHPVLDLLDRFNEATTSSDGFYNTESHINLVGDSFWLLSGPSVNNGLIESIYLLPPDKVEIDLGDISKGANRLILGYRYKDTINGKRVSYDYQPEEVLHIKSPNPKNMVRGLSRVEAAADSIDQDVLANEANRKYYERGMIQNFALSTDKNVNDDQVNSLQAKLKAMYSGVKNAFKVPIFTRNLKPIPLQMNNKDMSFMEQQEWLRDKIMVIFGNTKASLGIIDDVNRASHESSILSWKEETIKPDMRRIVDALNEFLVPRYGSEFLLSFKNPVPEDQTQDIDTAVKLKEARIITANEARQSLGYEPITEDDADRLNPEVPQIALPPDAKNVNYKAVFRRNGIYEKMVEKRKLYLQAKAIAKEYIAKRKAGDAYTEHSQFTDDKVWDYWAKQIFVVDNAEEQFNNKVISYINRIEAEVLENLGTELSKKWQTKELFDEEAEILRATLDFEPILMGVASSAGQQALKLVGVDRPYNIFDIQAQVRKNIEKFAGSMLDTEKDKLTKIIAEGVREGKSVPQIRREIETAFDNFRKVQAERITRSEVIRVSNQASLDAFEQSGVVEAKQWLTAEDERVCPYCEPLNGKIVGLRENYFDKGDKYFGNSDTAIELDYSEIDAGNLHVGCRCVVLPVLEGKGYKESLSHIQKSEYESKIKELQSQVDKRTKAYKRLMAKKLDAEALVTELSRVVDEQKKPK